MAVDPYSSCPCGSGQKFKWCCHKVEEHAERADRLFQNGQAEGAIQALDEGLKKDPNNPWLLTRKAVYYMRLGQNEPAKVALRQLLHRNPKHLGASILLTRLAIDTEGPAAGAFHFQETLAIATPENIANLAPLAEFVGLTLNEYGKYAAAIAHVKLGEKLEGEAAKKERQDSHLPSIERDERISPWLKNPYTLLPTPAKAPADVRERFNQALGWAESGLWSSAASAFDLIASDASPFIEAEYNQALCRLWLADDSNAAAGFRRYLKRLGNSTEAVDLEALCQIIDTPRPEDLVEQVQLNWPLRDRAALLEKLRNDVKVEEIGSVPVDSEDEESAKLEHFGILDRPKLGKHDGKGLKTEDIPLFIAKIVVGPESVAVETYDDGRLDNVIERFTSLADGAIPPAHPKTKILGETPKRDLALSWEWLLPEDADETESTRLDREQCARLVREVWVKTPMQFLGNRTPVDAAKAGDALIPLRAALCLLEFASEDYSDLVDFPNLRSTLGVDQEPKVDPATVNVDSVHLSRLRLIPVEPLNDEALGALYQKARRFALSKVMEKTLRVLVDRPEAWERLGLQSVTLFSQLAFIASNAGHKAEALEWIERGRKLDSDARKSAHAPLWEMVQIRVRAVSEPPESWVPSLSIALDRSKNDPAASHIIMLNLLEMGLLRLVPNPDRNGEVYVDSRALQMVLAEYGPRITTSTGELGVSAAKGGIWTPGEGSSSGGGIWTPGSESGTKPAQDKPKLILPGT
ncbi:tetratricopeptide repeat protein [Singulisphaera sp. PoT]|uniref:tetratricopeptide repeat protein n=1 Tax=Singulisphaera sp. PoT TaxID=3411797 RepID=UPI003BF4733F